MFSTNAVTLYPLHKTMKICLQCPIFSPKILTKRGRKEVGEEGALMSLARDERGARSKSPDNYPSTYFSSLFLISERLHFQSPFLQMANGCIFMNSALNSEISRHPSQLAHEPLLCFQ